MKTILIYHRDWERRYEVSDEAFDVIAQALTRFRLSEGRGADPEWFFAHLPAELALHVNAFDREPRVAPPSGEQCSLIWIDEAIG